MFPHSAHKTKAVQRASRLMAGLLVAAVPVVLIYARAQRKPVLSPGNKTPARSAARSAMPHQPTLSPFQQRVLAELQRQVHANIRYQDTYYRGGEPPANIGVCTDVILRAFRAGGVDLQRKVTADIRAHSGKYPLSHPDPNIDHRRCRNLVVFFRRHARSLPTEGAKADWQTGDVVFWDTGNRGIVDHVGMTAGERDTEGDLAVVHHWPGMPVSETTGLHGWTIRYHFRWPQSAAASGKNHRQ